jgi:tetratricopeptide (TPR) repeat protein
MANEVVVPILPCPSVKEVLTFYNALGFTTTYAQTHPNPYVCVKLGDLELHFGGIRNFDPTQSYASCIVLVEDADALYQSFVSGMRQQYGKILVSGIPRMTRIIDKSTGGRGFNLIDPGGNWIRIVQPAQIQAIGDPTTGLSKGIHAAQRLSENKGDYEQAAKTLDIALVKNQDALTTDKVRAWITRAGIAMSLNDPQQALALLAQVRDTPLSEAEQAEIHADLQAMRDLELLLAESLP